MKKHIFVAMLVLCMVLTSAVFGQTPAGADSAKPAGEPGKLKVAVIKHPLTQPIANMEFIKAIEAYANVSVEWEEYQGSDWAEKKNVVLASGDVPDVFVSFDALSDVDIENFSHLFVPLNDMLDKAPNISAMFEENPMTRQIAMNAEGTIYSIGFFKGIWPENWCRMVINQTWLDKLDLDMPTTWDEFHQVLLAFKNGDPNGNGVADEIPLNWNGGGRTTVDGFSISVILGGYGLLSANERDKGYFIDNGKVANKYADPRMKELIAFLHELQKDGLINPQVFTDDYAAFKALGRSPDVPVLGVGFGWDLPGVVGMGWADQYTVMPPLKPNKDYNGPVYYSDYDYNSLNYGGHCITMTQKCTDKDAALRFMDAFYNPEISLQVLFGSIPECIEKTGENAYHILPPADPAMDAGTWKWTKGLGDTGPYYISPKLDLEYAYIDQIRKLDGDFLKYNEGITPEMIWPATFVKYSKEDAAFMAVTEVDTQNIMLSKFAQWVTNGGVEQEWDQYLQDLNNAGLSKDLEIKQKYYEAFLDSIG